MVSCVPPLETVGRTRWNPGILPSAARWRSTRKDTFIPEAHPRERMYSQGRHSWNVGIIFYRDPFFLFTRPCYVGFVKVTWLAGHFPNLLHFCRESFHFVAEKLKNEFSRVDFPDIESVSTKSIDVSDLNCKGWISTHISKEKSVHWRRILIILIILEIIFLDWDLDTSL